MMLVDMTLLGLPCLSNIDSIAPIANVFIENVKHGLQSLVILFITLKGVDFKEILYLILSCIMGLI